MVDVNKDFLTDSLPDLAELQDDIRSEESTSRLLNTLGEGRFDASGADLLAEIEEEVRDCPFQDLRLGYESVDWDDPEIDADFISRSLTGKVTYWKDAEFEGLDPFEIEKHILYTAGWWRWNQISPHGKPYYQHLLLFIKLLMPETDITTNLHDAVMFFCHGINGDIKILNLLGSQDSGKSGGSTRISMACMALDPELTQIYVANPFERASDSSIWGEFEECYEQIMEHHPDLWPNSKPYRDRKIEIIRGLGKAGSIEMRNVKNVGQFKGTKTRKRQRGVIDQTSNKRHSLILMILDEVNEIENLSFLGILSNICSQYGYFAITSQNPKDPNDLGGLLCQPVDTFGGPSTYKALKKRLSSTIWWHSAVGSVSVRYPGPLSPNILARKEIYTYLYKYSNHRRLVTNYGAASPEMLSQGLAFFGSIDGDNTVLNDGIVSKSRHTDTLFTIVSEVTSVSFCDPSFGGKDKAMWGYGNHFKADVIGADGTRERTELLYFPEEFEKIALVEDATVDQSWIDRFRAVDLPVRMLTLGKTMTFEDQIMLACKEKNQERGIPNANFGYDFSMRPDIVSSVNQGMGFDTVAFDYQKKPEGHLLWNTKEQTEEVCFNRNDELCFLVKDLFLCRQIRGGFNITAAIAQMQRTRVEKKAGKHKVESKIEYKARWQQVSPDDRDTMMGIVGMAHKRGFRIDSGKPVGKNGRRGASSSFSLLRDKTRRRSSIGPKLKYD